MSALFVYTEPDTAGIMAPQCMILDSMPAGIGGVICKHNSVGICPAVPALHFTKTLLRLFDYLSCWLAPHPVPCSYLLYRTVEQNEGATFPPRKEEKKGSCETAGSQRADRGRLRTYQCMTPNPDIVLSPT